MDEAEPVVLKGNGLEVLCCSQLGFEDASSNCMISKGMSSYSTLSSQSLDAITLLVSWKINKTGIDTQVVTEPKTKERKTYFNYHLS